ncbi:hypothetical protein O181_057236 [Austropuccinia psidii MF-1]|uniref:Uncharacterized protein n=1 Tax=Austropuccinia psidii MF-1 TaxID=1389203 RepID=A0A9Q3EES2_9BASI|nr:hypothetical protein [Austropuccinia psidii MF-1]
MEGEANQLRMPEPQTKEGGIAEGEDSVSSVSLELMTKKYASRRFNTSESVHFNSKTMYSRKWGHTSMMTPLKASKVKIQDPFGDEFITQDLPCNFGEARILMVLDPLNGSRPWSHGTPGCPAKLGPGGLQ